MALSTLPTRRAAFRLLDEAVAGGIEHFDTARIYGRGFSERVLGEFLAAHAKTLRVTTKLGPSDLGNSRLPSRIALPLNWLRRRFKKTASPLTRVTEQCDLPAARIDRQHIEASVEASLRCLRRSTLDVFLLHEALPHQLTDNARAFVGLLLKERTIGAFGVGAARKLILAHYVDDPLCSVLQYDMPPGQACDLLATYPATVHIHHSILRNLSRTPPSALLRDALMTNRSGKVIFGTRSPNHLRQNIGLIRTAHATC